MSELPAKSELKKVILPSSKDKAPTEQDWVVLEHGGLIGADIFRVTPNENPMAVQYDILVGRIKEWSMTENGEPAEINHENVGRLSLDDLTFLIKELGLVEGGESGDPKASVTS